MKPFFARPSRIAAAVAASLCLIGPAFAFDSFQIADIRLEGLERIAAGTVFSYLPIERGDTLNDRSAGEAIRALYKTGFFNDVQIGRDGNILVLTLVERPAISRITLVGNKDIKSEDLLSGLRNIGLAEGETYDRLALDRVTQELTRQYNNRGKYNVKITPDVKQLDRNRVDLTITVAEGKAAKIRHINIVGNTVFTDEEIREEFEANESNWLSWYRKDDQYSREKLQGDLEKLRAYYLDRGYVDFQVESTQVNISPDRREIYINANVREGEVYTIGDVKLTGEFVYSEEALQGLVQLKEGDTFSRARLEQTSESITAALANIGYAFADVTPIPEIDRENRIVGVTFLVEPGRRVYVRRINLVGNSNTRDEVLRRELRQFEGGWYSQALIDRSKIRLQRLPYISEVNIETPRVAGTEDQVDIDITVEERNSGQFQFGLGYSETQGLITQVSLNFDNFLGTGNRVGLALSNNSVFTQFNFSYLNPYYTDDGVSRGFNVLYRELDSGQANIASYFTDTAALGVVYGIPLTEFDRIQFGVSAERQVVQVIAGFTPTPFLDFLLDDEIVNPETGQTERDSGRGSGAYSNLRAQLSWARDTRNRFFTPTQGTLQRAGLEFTLPGSDLEYYKFTYQYQRFFPLTKSLTFMANGEVGYGDAYGGDKKDFGLPFFENFYNGGVRSVRGFRDNTLGPRLLSGSEDLPVGGALNLVGNAEIIFPAPFGADIDTLRLSLFFDVGQVFKDFDAFDAGELRYSTGISVQWQAPVGPIVLNLAVPLNDKEGDETESLQFSFGNTF
ncbi:MAG: outer membrane protein assembly factor BamA [Xanthomonadales bacterium]|nr:outer membrane protein assembly factor BamA [Xanthomonadales bacterium]